MESSNWVETRALAGVANRARGALDTIGRNEVPTKLMLAVQMTPSSQLLAKSRNWIPTLAMAHKRFDGLISTVGSA